MRKNPYGRILRSEFKEQHLSIVHKSCSILIICFFIQDNYYYIKIIKNFKKCYPIYETFNIEFYIKLREEHIHKKKKKNKQRLSQKPTKKKIRMFWPWLKANLTTQLSTYIRLQRKRKPNATYNKSKRELIMTHIVICVPT